MSLGEIQTQSDWCPQKERNVKTHRTSCGQESKHVSQEMPEMLTRPGSQESAGQVLPYPPCQHLDLGRSPAYRSKRHAFLQHALPTCLQLTAAPLGNTGGPTATVAPPTSLGPSYLIFLPLCMARSLLQDNPQFIQHYRGWTIAPCLHHSVPFPNCHCLTGLNPQI